MYSPIYTLFQIYNKIDISGASSSIPYGKKGTYFQEYLIVLQ
jgi:hypothetical protein